MRKPPTKVLLILGICLLLVAPLFLRGVTVLRPVLTSSGEPVLRSDGRPLLRNDVLGQPKANREHTLWPRLVCYV